jgi:hypothetical protein
MKDSVLKFVALALLIVVFATVVITARWADNSTCDKVNKPAQATCEIALKSNPIKYQTTHVNTQVDTGDNWARIASAGMRNDNLGSTVEDREQQQGHSTQERASQPEEEPDDGAEPPDDNEDNKDSYGKADVE